MTWVDSHCHLQMLDGGTPEAVKDAVAEAVAAGVTTMVCVGTDLTSSQAAAAIAAADPATVAATAGLHPHDAADLARQWDGLEALVDAGAVVGVGETGFDLHYNRSPAADQERSFREHIRLARRAGLALVIHSRDAWDDTFRVLADEGVPERTVFHCFTGGPDEARRALDIGASLSFSGIVSFANADDVRAAAALVPMDRLLVETDAPFLAPVPHRGQPNRPAWVAVVGAELAAAVGRDPTEVAAATAGNARALFGLTP